MPTATADGFDHSEDEEVVRRLKRQPDRRVIVVDVPAVGEAEAMRVARAFRDRMRRHRHIDPLDDHYLPTENPGV